MDCSTARHEEDQNFRPLSLGYRNLRAALAAFILGDPAPESMLPGPSETNRLAFGGDKNRGLDGILNWMIETNVS